MTDYRSVHEPFRHNDEKCGGNGPTRFLGVDREAIRRLSPDALEGYWYADALAKRDRERREAALQGDLRPPSIIESTHRTLGVPPRRSTCPREWPGPERRCAFAPLRPRRSSRSRSRWTSRFHDCRVGRPSAALDEAVSGCIPVLRRGSTDGVHKRVHGGFTPSRLDAKIELAGIFRQPRHHS